MRRNNMAWLALVLLVAATPVLASFAGTDVVVPSVGRGGGSANSNWYSTVWVHNPNGAAAQVQIFLLERLNANPSPAVYNDTIPAGDTRRWTNAVETLFGVAKFGALRVVSSAKVVVNARVYSQPAGGGDEDTTGQFFSGVPASFAVKSGQKTQILGTYQTRPTADSDYRYNFGFAETAGASVSVRVKVLDETGAQHGSKDYSLGARGVAQYAFKDEFPAISTQNARLEVEVLSGNGGVVAFGSGIANSSNDPSTFEMQFADELLGSGSSGGGDITGVTAGAGLTGGGTSGDVTIGIGPEAVTGGMIATGAIGSSELADGAVQTADIATSAVTAARISTSGGTAGQVLTVTAGGAAWQAVSAGPGGDITSVLPLAGGGLAGGGSSGAVTLGIAGKGITAGMIGDGMIRTLQLGDGGVETADLAPGAVTKSRLSASGGSNGQVLGTDGTNLVWRADNAGGIALPYSDDGSSSGDLFYLRNDGTGRGIKIETKSDTALWAIGGTGHGVDGRTAGSGGAGVIGTSSVAGGEGVHGYNSASTFVGFLGGGQYAVYGSNGNSISNGYAGYFHGRVHVTKDLTVAGALGADGIEVDSGWQEPFTVSTTFFGGTAISGVANNGGQSCGIYGSSTGGYAGYFMGKVHVNGTLSKSAGSFKIDHPLDPANKYLSHSFVESPDMMNVYNGNVVLNEKGEAVVELPKWFEALNRDFRYQLTAIGAPGPNLYVGDEIAGNRFRIVGGTPRGRVSWQVTGIRKDAYAEAHPIPVEEEKPAEERGFFMFPELFGAPEEQGIEWAHHPVQMRQEKQARETAARTASR
ncbi:MAG TPA: hypothetical protein PLS53_12650 [Thermoanaerobaculaceae bacterium]|nr:hypothetical protein [Thermoanaerobaculaceae bacterium]